MIPASDKIIAEAADGIGWLTLNNPARRNAISLDMALANGQILLAAASDRVWERFCKAVGADRYLTDPRHETGTARLANRDTLNDQVAVRTRTSQYWFDLLSEAGVPCRPVNSIDEVFADRQVRHLGMATPASHRDLGTLSMVAQPTNIEGHVKAVRLQPPGLGEHMEAILHGLRYPDGDIAGLRERSVV